MIATTIEQSRRLTSCGVTPETTKMYLSKAKVPPAQYYHNIIPDEIDRKDWFSYRGNKDIIPSWSLTDLLAVLPREIWDDGFHWKIVIEAYGDGWYIAYKDSENGHILLATEDIQLIEACVQMAERLTTRGYKLNLENVR